MFANFLMLLLKLNNLNKKSKHAPNENARNKN